MKQIENVLTHFALDEPVCEVKPIGTGHINTTYRVKLTDGSLYTLQAINTYVFQEPEKVMENILAVTNHVRRKILQEGGNPERECLTVILTDEKKPYYCDEEGTYWRIYRFVDRAKTYDIIENPVQLYQAGLGFGHFQYMLSDFDMSCLHETIPDFHNTKKRMESFFESVQRDKMNRAASVKSEIEFLERRYEDAILLCDMVEKGQLPLRVTHNDTKVNNILIDEESSQALCVIDLDTVMPGLTALDFGDAIRFAANHVEEDERDLSKVSMDLELYEQFTKGFFCGIGNGLTVNELDYLPHGAKVITLELASRFLADYLDGDVYFKIHHKEQNLDRTRCQLALVQSMEEQFDAMCRIAERCRQ